MMEASAFKSGKRVPLKVAKNRHKSRLTLRRKPLIRRHLCDARRSGPSRARASGVEGGCYPPADWQKTGVTNTKQEGDKATPAGIHPHCRDAIPGPTVSPPPCRGPRPSGPRDLCRQRSDTAGLQTALYKPPTRTAPKHCAGADPLYGFSVILTDGKLAQCRAGAWICDLLSTTAPPPDTPPRLRRFFPRAPSLNSEHG